MGAPAHAWEPSSGKWTPVVEQTLPEHLVHYATLPADEARQMLSASDAALLYDRAQGFDLVPDRGVTLRSLEGLSRSERFKLTWVPPEQGGGYALFDTWVSRNQQNGRVDDPQTPIERVWGLPTGRRGRPGRLSPFDPMVVEFGGTLYAIRYVTLRVRDPMDPTRATSTAEIVTGTAISLDAILPEPRETYRMALTFRLGASSRPDPRLVFLPVTPDGFLDPGRDGVVVRLAVTGARVDPWTRNIDDSVLPVAVRLHLGDRDTLQAHLDSLPAPPRERFAEPGSPSDPLLMGPRAHGAPLGAGVQLDSGIDGALAIFDPFGGGALGGKVLPAWPGVRVEGWVGRAVVGTEISADRYGLQGGFRAGTMRDTDSTVILAELGYLPATYTRFGLPWSAALVIRSRRLTPNTLFDRSVEMGSDLRIGTDMVGYRALAGLRFYLGNGVVLTPTASAGLRYDIRRSRADAVIGISLDTAINRNVFRDRVRTPTSESAAGEAPESAPDDRGADPPAR